MVIDKQLLNVFFFGSPAEGFTSYPVKFSHLVNGLDKGSSKHHVECRFIIDGNKNKIQYAEYGLTGVGQDGKSKRGGRNFGIWIEIEGHKINQVGQKKIKSYIEGFIDNGLVKQAHIFESEKLRVRHFLVNSFNDVSEALDKLIEVFKEEFIKDFSRHIRKINKQESYQIDLNPIPEITPSSSKNISNEVLIREGINIGDTIKVNVPDGEAVVENLRKRKKFDFVKLNTVLLVILALIFLFNIEGNVKSGNTQQNNKEIIRLSAENEKLRLTISKLKLEQNPHEPLISGAENNDHAEQELENLKKQMALLPSTEDVMSIQKLIGVSNPDGKWGDMSRASLKEFMDNH